MAENHQVEAASKIDLAEIAFEIVIPVGNSPTFGVLARDLCYRWIIDNRDARALERLRERDRPRRRASADIEDPGDPASRRRRQTLYGCARREKASRKDRRY
jgi:hypothetical protein